MDDEIVIWLPWPPTVNDYWKPIRGSLYLSKRARLYKEAVCEAVNEQVPGVRLDDNLLIEVYLFPPDKRVRDIDNYNKGLLDALTASSIWTDDNLVKQMFTYMGEAIPKGAVRIEISAAGPIVPYELD